MKSTLQPRSITEMVVEYIKIQVQDNHLNPGDRLNERELSAQLGVSRTPIREALIQLESEGLVEILPRKCIKIRKLSPKEIREIYEMVGVLESEIAVNAVDLMEEKDFRRMEDIFQAMLTAHKKSDMPTYLELNWKLHNIHLSRCDNQLMLSTLENLKKRLINFPRNLKSIPDWVEDSIQEHRALIKAFRSRDKSTIYKILKEKHWATTKHYHYPEE